MTSVLPQSGSSPHDPLLSSRAQRLREEIAALRDSTALDADGIRRAETLADQLVRALADLEAR